MRSKGRTNIKGRERFKGEVRRWALRIGVEPKRLQIQHMTTKWASCSTSGRVCFNRDLLGEGPAFREVVIVHELLHLQVPNHGNLFRSLMNAYLPRWEETSKGRVAGRCGYNGINR